MTACCVEELQLTALRPGGPENDPWLSPTGLSYLGSIKVVRFSLIVAFSFVLGRVVWGTFGPAYTPDYAIGGATTALGSPAPEAKQLYLRLDVYLPERPRHAWLEVVTHDSLDVYVNGHLVKSLDLHGFPVGLSADLTTDLQIGTNVIGIAVHQTSIDQPPIAAVRGAYVLSDGEHPISVDSPWRCGWTLERRAGWWFERTFDDRQWPSPQRITNCYLRSQQTIPPRATAVMGAARWIALPAPEARTIAVRREFAIQGRPTAAWLRVTAKACYRLAINEMVVDEQEDGLGTPEPVVAVRRLYDISQFLQRGENVVALVLTSMSGTPAMLADLEVGDAAGRRCTLGTDRQWMVQAGTPGDWCRLEHDAASAWQACAVEAGDLGVPPWGPARIFVPVDLPFWAFLWRGAGQIAVTVLLAAAIWLVCRWLERLLSRNGSRVPSGMLLRKQDSHSHQVPQGGQELLPAAPSTAAPLVYFALLPSTALIAAVIFATYDSRVPRQFAYQSRWVVLAVLAVLLQWAWIFFNHQGAKRHTRRASHFRYGRLAVVAMVLLLVAVAFGLRLRRLTSEALQTDEIWQIMAVNGISDRGFPSFQANDLPVNYITTSESIFYFMALVSLFTQDGHLMNRIPSLIFGTLTVPLLYLAGRRMFSRGVGLVAASLAAFSPICIQMSEWGRYPAQLGFMTLFTVYFFWRTVQGDGPVNHRTLWLTALGFIGMFLCWEGGCFVAVGMTLAALLLRRGRLGAIVSDGSVWLAMLAVLTVVVAQYSFRTLQLTSRLWYGTGITDVTLTPMWRYPDFEPLYYLWESTWNRDAFLPAMLFLVGVVVSIGHRFARATRYLGVVIVSTCLIMALLLPLREERYIFHVVPLVILFCSAGMVGFCRSLMQFALRLSDQPSWKAYAFGVLASAAVVLVVLASGWTVRLNQMKAFDTQNFGPNDIRFPDITAACRYLRKHIQPGDMVMTDRPHMIDYLITSLGGDARGTAHTSDYYLQTTLFIQVALPDHGDVPVNFFRGIPVITSQESMDDVLARHPRIWYVIWPGVSLAGNTRQVTQSIRDQMEVVYEDFWAMVLLLENNHRTVGEQMADEKALRRAGALFIR